MTPLRGFDSAHVVEALRVVLHETQKAKALALEAERDRLAAALARQKFGWRRGARKQS